MDKMRHLISALLGLLALAILAIGCGGPEPVRTVSPAQTPTTQATEPASPTPSLLPTATPWPTETPVPPTATARSFPVPKGLPYEGEPFAIVFMRDGELWTTEVGGQAEWQLTHEGPDWAVGDFTISPDGQYVAFMTWDQTATSPRSQSQCVKLVRVRDGSVRALTSPDDPYHGFNPTWWDARHVTFQVWPREGFSDTKLPPYMIVVIDVETGERTFEPASAPQIQSPDGRYILRGGTLTVRPTSESYWLYDRETGERWALTGEDEETKFLSWSPDSRWILFGLSRDGEGPDTLFSVDVETRTRRVLTPAGKTVCGVTAWSPDSRAIAYFQCGRYTCGGANCGLWLIAPDGSNQRTVPVSVPDFAIGRMAWTPDGSRLVFNESRHNPLPEGSYDYIWSVRVDGADLRQIAIGQQEWFQVLPGPTLPARTPTTRREPPRRVVHGTGDFPRLPVIGPGADGITLVLYMVEGDRATQLVEFEGTRLGGWVSVWLSRDGIPIANLLRNSSVWLSPNGRRVAALLRDGWDRTSTLVVVDVATAGRARLDRGTGDLAATKGAAHEDITGLVWLDDEHILYSKATSPGAGEVSAIPGHGEIWLTDLTGAERRRLAEAAVYRVLGASPDGKQAYFSCEPQQEGYLGDGFCVLDVASGELRVLWPRADYPMRGSSASNTAFFGYKLVTMPDGVQRVVFVGTDARSARRSEPPDVWLGDPESGEASIAWAASQGKTIADCCSVCDVPVDFLWSPRSEREFVYLGDGAAFGGVWRVDAESRQARNLMTYNAGLVAWAEEGIVVQSAEAVWLLDESGEVRGEIRFRGETASESAKTLTGQQEPPGLAVQGYGDFPCLPIFPTPAYPPPPVTPPIIAYPAKE